MVAKQMPNQIKLKILWASPQGVAMADEDKVVNELFKFNLQITQQLRSKLRVSNLTRILKEMAFSFDGVILSFGAVGFKSRDLVPEAVLKVISKRAYGIEHSLYSIQDNLKLFRLIAGTYKNCFIIALPEPFILRSETLKLLADLCKEIKSNGN
jgi:molybdopterin biosynthesis enzyme MoaB